VWKKVSKVITQITKMICLLALACTSQCLVTLISLQEAAAGKSRNVHEAFKLETAGMRCRSLRLRQGAATKVTSLHLLLVSIQHSVVTKTLTLVVNNRLQEKSSNQMKSSFFIHSMLCYKEPWFGFPLLTDDFTQNPLVILIKTGTSSIIHQSREITTKAR